MDRDTLCEKLAACILGNYEVLAHDGRRTKGEHHWVGQGDLGRQLKTFCEMFVCPWWYCENGNYWQTDCGEMFRLLEGGPTENCMVHCHYCGNLINVVSSREEALEVWKTGTEQYEQVKK